MHASRTFTVRVCVGLLALGLAALGAPAGAQCPDPTPVTLQPGLAVTLPDVAVSCTTGARFRIDVPETATSLRVTTRGGTGNADLLAQFGAVPGVGAPQYLAGGTTNDETLIVEDPPAGFWYVLVKPTSGFSGVKLVADYSVKEIFIAPGLNPGRQSDRNTTGPRFRFFRVQVPEGARGLHVRTHGGTGNVDLFVRKGSVPTNQTFDFASTNAGNDDGVDIDSPIGGAWKIGMYRASEYADVEIEVEIDPGGDCLSGEQNLCLMGARFRVEVDWINQHDGGTTGAGNSVVETDQSGAFYFFARDNPELVVKMIDGRALNAKFWVFWGGLTDLEYNIRITDTQTDVVKIFHHPPGVYAGGADTSAFGDTP